MSPRRSDEVPVFFDLDGTLADSAGGIVASLEHALAVCRVPAATIDWRQHIGPPLQRMLAAALPDLTPGYRESIVSAYRGHYATVGIFMTTLFPGVAELIAEIATRGAVLYIVTNKPQKPAEEIVRHLELDGFVRRVVGGDPAGHGTKPDRAAQLVAEEGLSRGCFIGDSLDDLAAAERIGARFFLAGWGYGTAHVLADRPDVAVVEAPTRLVQQIFAGHAEG
jgi:phosphoglycolate phosphatase